METYKDFADNYLENHPNGSYYNELTYAAKLSCITLAVEDISAYLGVERPNSEDSVELAAIAEQALWILEKAQAKKEKITYESINGLGSRSYSSTTSDYSKFIADRAIALLEPRLLAYANIISRG